MEEFEMAKVKDFGVSIMPSEVVYTNISTSAEGYNSARIVAKRGDKQYLSVSYEWSDGGVPDFAVDLMAFMKDSSMETSGIWPGQEEAFEDFAAKMSKEEFVKMMQDKKKKGKDGDKKEEDMTPEEKKAAEDKKKKEKKAKK
jgi:hypothetical protein